MTHHDVPPSVREDDATAVVALCVALWVAAGVGWGAWVVWACVAATGSTAP
jgi:uncharacterized protein HemX